MIKNPLKPPSISAIHLDHDKTGVWVLPRTKAKYYVLMIIQYTICSIQTVYLTDLTST